MFFWVSIFFLFVNCMLQNKIQRKKRTTISTMSGRNFKRLISMEICRLNPLITSKSSSIINTSLSSELSTCYTKTPSVMNVQNNYSLNSSNNNSIINNTCDFMPLSNVSNNFILHNCTNNIDVNKDTLQQNDLLSDIYLNPISDQNILNNHCKNDTSTEINKLPTLHHKLCKLSSDYNISHNAMNEILSIFRSEGHNNVPKDVRTLLKTPTTYNIINIRPGFYIHLGIEFMLKPVLKMYQPYFNTSINNIKLSFNIDGLPISKCSKSAFWPILMSIINIPVLINKVFTVGIYHSHLKKPDVVEEFLNPFVEEVLTILQNGMIVNTKVFTVTISQIICDAPAKAYILNVKGHMAYFGCNMCIEEGDFIKGMTYPGVDAPRRTNESFRSKSNEEYHKGPSPLEHLPIDIISVVSLDYMHVVCLGVVKRLIRFWVNANKMVRIPQEKLNLLDINIENLRKYYPSDFSRLPRSFQEFENFKATELRALLLYTGPFLLKGILRKNQYKHFMLLHSSMRLLVAQETHILYNDLATSLIKQFINDYMIIYGPEYISYNVHNLVHLPECVKIHGPLDKFSVFKYENHLQEIKKKIKKTRFPLQEAYNRIIEKTNLSNNSKIDTDTSAMFPVFKYEIYFDVYRQSIVDPTIKMFKQLCINHILLNSDKIQDRYVMLSCNQIAKVLQIIQNKDNSITLNICKFNNISPFFNDPISSDVLGLFYVDTSTSSEPMYIHFSCVLYKCFFIPILENKAIVMSMIHSHSSE